MLYHLIKYLSLHFDIPGAGMFLSLSFRAAMGIILALVIGMIFGKRIIRMLQRRQIGEEIRNLGLEGQLQKRGTPTMGGIIILASILIPILLFGDLTNIYVLLMIVSTVWLGLIGFLDDYIKIVMKRSEGLNPKQKLLGQIVITGIFAYYLMTSGEVGTEMLIPFTGGFENGYFLDLGWLFVPALFFIVLGTDNGVNFTDGLDGLCTSVTILVATFFTVVALGEESGISPITGAVVGSLLGFLLFNVYPARVFMGDTGSLALGGFVASSAYMMQMPVFIAIVGLIYLVEVLSVIIQVTYFKKTGGKRIFKMAPIHHHFELCGWSETRVVAVFSIITAILCLVAYLGL